MMIMIHRNEGVDDVDDADGVMVMLLRMLATTSEEIELRELIMQKRSTTGSMVIVAHIDFA